MYRKEIEKRINELIRFRSYMELNLSVKKAQYIWGRGVIKELPDEILKKLVRSTKVRNSKIIKEKIEIVKQNMEILLIFNWVRFIGISGSTAAGFVKDEDDIDLFIVVRDGCAWIYRGILVLKNIFNYVIRTGKDGGNVKNLFCINFIIEERALEVDRDIFNFHELMYLIPMYNEGYINYIFKQNRWLLDDFFVNKELLQSNERRKKYINIFVRAINLCAFFLQIFFMIIKRHSPEIKRLFKNYKIGKIEFFPSGYKGKIMKKFNSYH